MKKMKLRYRITLVALFLVVLGATGCQTAKEAIERADAAVEEARAAQADRYAAQEFQSAEEYLAQARQEYKNWKFKNAESSANTAEAQAKLALQRALDRAREKQDARKPRPGEPGWREDSSLFGSTLPEDAAQLAPLRDIHFEFDESRLTSEAMAIMEDNARWIKAHPGVIIEIEGHCDERGTEEYNIALGQRRADSTKAYLVNYGIESARLRTISYGEALPLDPGHSEEAWAKNRRAHFVIIRR